MFETIIIFFSVIVFLSFVVWLTRRQSITGIPVRNRHFSHLGEVMNFKEFGDDYFLQLEGTWNEIPVIIYPHNFEGPGSITIFYADTGVPLIEQSWVEPILSLGRGIVEWKRGQIPRFDFHGDPALKKYPIVEVLERYKIFYPYLAITLPDRFVFSHFLQESLSVKPNFIALLVMDSGRRPKMEQITEALNAVTEIAAVVQSAFKVDSEK